MKADKNFRLSKQSKRFMATIVDKEARGVFKRAMIQAELAEAHAKIARSKEKEKN